MKIKIKKLNEQAVIPAYAHDTDAGLDLTAINATMEMNQDASVSFIYETGLSIEIPEGYVGLVFPRSSVSQYSLTQANCVGVIDSGYRGELLVKFKLNTMSYPKMYKPGDRVAQLVIVPYLKAELEVTEELTQSDRGENGFGSTNVEEDLKDN